MTVAVLAVGAGSARAQSGDVAAIAAGEVAVQCMGDGMLTDHLASLRSELTRARARLGQQKAFLERVKSMDLNRLTAMLTKSSGDARATRDFEQGLDAGGARGQSSLRIAKPRWTC